MPYAPPVVAKGSRAFVGLADLLEPARVVATAIACGIPKS